MAPSKITQAQALFAVLSGNSLSRRDRMYLRHALLRSTLYNPIETEQDLVVSIPPTLDISKTTITLIYPTLDSDLTQSSVTLEISKEIAVKPEWFDSTQSLAPSFAISKSFVYRTNATDSTQSLAPIFSITKYVVVKGSANDTTTSSVSLEIIKT